MCSPVQLEAAWLLPLLPLPAADTFLGGKFSSTAAVLHALCTTYATLLHLNHQLSLFATAFLPLSTPPHLEVSDCGAIQQIVRRTRGWSRSRFYSRRTAGNLPFSRATQRAIPRAGSPVSEHVQPLQDFFLTPALPAFHLIFGRPTSVQMISSWLI